MTLELVDISVWNPVADWGALERSGIAGVLAKASEGDGFEDPRWRSNQAALLASKVLVGGSYHFSREDLGNSPQAEATWYVSRHDSAVFLPTTPWIFALDAESAGGSAAWCYAFMDAVASQLQGLSPWFYSYSSWITSRGVRAFNRPLWLAWPDANGDIRTFGWGAVSMQQYGVRSVPGVAGEVDANRFFGDLPQLLALIGASGGAPTPTPPPGGPPMPIEDSVTGVSVQGTVYDTATNDRSWRNWSDLSFVAGQVAAIGLGVTWTEAKKVAGKWYDRIENADGSPGDWCLEDGCVNDGGHDPTFFRQPPPAPPPPAPTPVPPPTPTPPPAVDLTPVLAAVAAVQAGVDSMKAQLAALPAPAVDVVALANALAPHLPPQTDPAVVAADVIERLGKDLSAAGS